MVDEPLLKQKYVLNNLFLEHNTASELSLSYYSSRFHVKATYLEVHDENSINLKSLLINKEKNYLLKLKSHYPCTLLNLTDTSPVSLLFFDEKYYFSGASIYNANSEGSYCVSTAFKNILILKNAQPQNLKDLIRLEVALKDDETIKEDKPKAKYWIKNFKNDRVHGYKKFKRLNVGYPRFEIDKAIIDTVEFEEFLNIEEQRIPLFIGSQFGIYPRIDEIPNFFNGRKVIAILSKSLLSGHVSGLKLFQIEKNDKKFTYNEIRLYKNE